ncbi:MAG: Fe-S protein assembly co-chaperone HscB [Dongiaceae bacterium]
MAPNPYTRFGLAPSFVIDEAALEVKYHQLQQILHPDRFATKTPREKLLAQSEAVNLNEDYKILRDPVKRAETLLGLAGKALTDGEGKTIQDPAILMMALESREHLTEVKNIAQLEKLAQRNREEIDGIVNNLEDAFTENNLAEAQSLTLRLKYAQKFSEEIDVMRRRLNEERILHGLAANS